MLSVINAKRGEPMESTTAQKFIDRFGGYIWIACPDGWPVYSYRGRDYHLDDAFANPEAVMAASLEHGKNLIKNTFPVVELYSDPVADY